MRAFNHVQQGRLGWRVGGAPGSSYGPLDGLWNRRTPGQPRAWSTSLSMVRVVDGTASGFVVSSWFEWTASGHQDLIVWWPRAKWRKEVPRVSVLHLGQMRSPPSGPTPPPEIWPTVFPGQEHSWNHHVQGSTCPLSARARLGTCLSPTACKNLTKIVDFFDSLIRGSFKYSGILFQPVSSALYACKHAHTDACMHSWAKPGCHRAPV